MMNQQNDESLEFDDTFDHHHHHEENDTHHHHHHLPMELWQTQMSFRSDSSSTASSVDSSFLASPTTSFASPSYYRKSSYSNNNNNNNMNNTPSFGAIPEAHLESPTLGVDIEVIHTNTTDDDVVEETMTSTTRYHVDDAIMNSMSPTTKTSPHNNNNNTTTATANHHSSPSTAGNNNNSIFNNNSICNNSIYNNSSSTIRRTCMCLAAKAQVRWATPHWQAIAGWVGATALSPTQRLRGFHLRLRSRCITHLAPQVTLIQTVMHNRWGSIRSFTRSSRSSRSICFSLCLQPCST